MRRATAGILVALVVLAGCGSSGTGARADITVKGAMIPEPASPDVAAAYFTVTNRSSVADVLETARSSATPVASIHRSVETGNVSTMVATGPLTIKGHQSITLSPGALHLMLSGALKPLSIGEKVTVTLVFKRAGAVTFTAPVVNPDKLFAS